jgi:hypothetical protein
MHASQRLLQAIELTDERLTETKLSRRQFVETAAGGAAVLGAGAILAPKIISAAPARDTKLEAEASGVVKSVLGTTVASTMPSTWDLSADVVVVGGGGSGLPAALAARAQGASVLVVDANYDLGGHSIVSGGHGVWGAGTAGQIAYGIVDSPQLYYSDMEDWTLVGATGAPLARFNDRAFFRMYMGNVVATYNLLIANGESFIAASPTNGGTDIGESALRCYNNNAPPTSLYSPNGASGAAYCRPLEISARGQNVQFLLNYHMDTVCRSSAGNIVGIVAHYTGGRTPPGALQPLQSYADSVALPGNIKMTQAEVAIYANKAVILATGGHSSNVDFRRAFDSRLGPVYSNAGAPYSYQDASGELAAMSVGASLWGLVNQTLECGKALAANSTVGIYYGYSTWNQASPVFGFVGGTGLSMSNWQNAIIVNQVGQRIYNELQWSSFVAGETYQGVNPYTPFSPYNLQYITSSTAPGTAYNPLPYNGLNAALAENAFSQAPDWQAGPIWACFDSAAVTRLGWPGVTYPYVDTKNGFFFSAPTLSALAAATVGCPFQGAPMDGPTLTATVARYNSFVASGVDLDFGKTKPAYPISTPPYFLANVSPQCHDTRSGLRVNTKMQVMDWNGSVIPNLYCCGEVAGGCVQHGLARCSTGGYVAGVNAAGGTTPIYTGYPTNMAAPPQGTAPKS